eukprot:TRINITY_DN243_c0_g1_i5.p1 TRINITY_DN243_c0_g1~~TRINITY_DN243_c0_g1_i5.p1  ORF type:complete len:143 (-),score=6.07 TRINITY_DN243_c0_g1_i5:2036-2464(-)
MPWVSLRSFDPTGLIPLVTPAKPTQTHTMQIWRGNRGRGEQTHALYHSNSLVGTNWTLLGLLQYHPWLGNQVWSLPLLAHAKHSSRLVKVVLVAHEERKEVCVAPPLHPDKQGKEFSFIDDPKVSWAPKQYPCHLVLTLQYQ